LTASSFVSEDSAFRLQVWASPESLR
jgi:hypothetical protein